MQQFSLVYIKVSEHGRPLAAEMKRDASIRRSGMAWGVFIVLGFAIGVWLYFTGWWSVIPTALRNLGLWGIAASAGLILVQTVVPFAPFALLAGFNATAHGFWVGYAATWAGAFVGANLLYALARRTLRGFFRARADKLAVRHPRLRKFVEGIENQSSVSVFLAILTLRLQPWLPSSAIDIISGLSGVKWKPYALGTIAGQGPMIALEAFVGHRLLQFKAGQQDLWWMALGSAALFGVYVGATILRRRIHPKPSQTLEQSGHLSDSAGQTRRNQSRE